MGYIATGAVSFARGGTFTAPTQTATAQTATRTFASSMSPAVAQSLMNAKCGPGKEWYVPPGGTGYCRRKTSTSGTTAVVHETPADAIRQQCNQAWGFNTEKARICDAWLRAGKQASSLAAVFSCMERGYTGTSLDICVDGRCAQPPAPFEQIDEVLTQMAAQSSAQEAATLAQEQALVAAQRRNRWLLIGGLAAAGIVGFSILKKRRQ